METIPSRVGFVATSFSNRDVVGRETAKWAGILRAGGHECFYFAGEVDRDQERSVIVPEASCLHPDISGLHREFFQNGRRSSKTSGMIHAIRFHLKQNLYQFIKTFDINLLIIENACSLPLNLPLGLALSELIAETNLPAILHHYDFPWRHARFLASPMGDYLRAAFPPELPSAHHVAMNDASARELAMHANLHATVIPPALDFEHPHDEELNRGQQVRQAFGISPEGPIVVQPTAALPDKRLERGIEAAAAIDPGCTFLVTGHSPLEREGYRDRLIKLANTFGIELNFILQRTGRASAEFETGEDLPSPLAIHAASRWVSYPVTCEGIDPGFLEALYTRRPLVMARDDYDRSDLAAQGLQVFTIDETLEEDALGIIRSSLADQEAIARATQVNFDLGKRYYNLDILTRSLGLLLQRCLSSSTLGGQPSLTEIGGQ